MSMMVNPYIFAAAPPSPWAGPPGFIDDVFGEALGTGSTVAVAYPAGILADDVAVIHVFGLNGLNAQTWQTPAGWTLIGLSDLNSASYPSGAFAKRMSGGESGSVTLSMTGAPGGTSSVRRAVMSVWRGCAVSDPIFEGEGSTKGQSTNAISPAVITTGDSRTVINLIASDDDTATFTPPSGYSEHYEITSLLGLDGSMTANSEEIPTATTVGASTTVLATSERWSCISFALIPENP